MLVTCNILVIQMWTFVTDITSTNIIKRFAYTYSHNDQKTHKLCIGITSMDPALEVIISSMLKVMYISYTKLSIRHTLLSIMKYIKAEKTKGNLCYYDVNYWKYLRFTTKLVHRNNI